MANEFQQAPQQPMGPQPGFQPQGTPQLSFQEAIQKGIAGLTNFNGRARRSEYWWCVLGVGIVNLVAYLIFNSIIGGVFGSAVAIICSIACQFALAAVMARRLQDTNKPGFLVWIYLALFVIGQFITLIATFKANSDPFGALSLIGTATLPLLLGGLLGLVLLIFCVMDSNMGPNKYGPSEKYPA